MIGRNLFALFLSSCSVAHSARLGLLRVGDNKAKAPLKRELNSVFQQEDVQAAFRELFSGAWGSSYSYSPIQLSMSMSYPCPKPTLPLSPEGDGVPAEDTPVPAPADDSAMPSSTTSQAPTVAETPPPTASLSPTLIEGVAEDTDKEDPDVNAAEGEPDAGAPVNVGQTVMIVVLVVAAATVVGALVARKMYKSRTASTSSSGSLSDVSSDQAAMGDPSTASNLTNVDI